MDATSPRSAAEDFAEHHAGFFSEPFSELALIVRNVNTGVTYSADVEVEPVPHFTAFIRGVST